MGKSWSDLRADFSELVRERGLKAVSDVIPASTMTVWRLATGRVDNPTRAICASIERILGDRTKASEVQNDEHGTGVSSDAQG